MSYVTHYRSGSHSELYSLHKKITVMNEHTDVCVFILYQWMVYNKGTCMVFNACVCPCLFFHILTRLHFDIWNLWKIKICRRLVLLLSIFASIKSSLFTSSYFWTVLNKRLFCGIRKSQLSPLHYIHNTLDQHLTTFGKHVVFIVTAFRPIHSMTLLRYCLLLGLSSMKYKYYLKCSWHQLLHNYMYILLCM